MSNDVLKQAPEAQESMPSVFVSNLQLRPSELSRSNRRPGSRLTLQAVVSVFLLIAMLGLGALLQQTINRRIQAKAPVPIPAQPAIVEGAAPAQPAPAPGSEPATAPGAGAASASAINGAKPGVAEETPPEPESLRLQAVFFNPARPSIIINGRTAFVGDRVEGFRVTRILRNSATLVSATETNVLKVLE